MKAPHILEELRKTEKDESKSKIYTKDTRARVRATDREFQAELHDDLVNTLVNTLVKVSKENGLHEAGDKKNALQKAREGIESFWSTEQSLDAQESDEDISLDAREALEALETAKRRAKEKAREIASELAKPFCELEIIIQSPEDLRRGNASRTSEKSYLEEPQQHEWIQCMTSFKQMLYSAENNFERQKKQKLTKEIEKPELSGPITVALIDDGIQLLGVRFDDVSLTGRSFHPKPWNADYFPWYLSSGGHGTIMASQIHRICPRAHLSILKLEDNLHPQSKKRQITMKSAAQVRGLCRLPNGLSLHFTAKRTN